MSFISWIGAGLGWVATNSVLGAIAGWALGGAVESFVGRKMSANAEQPSFSDSEGNRNGFLFSLMVLSAHIIQADGKIMHSEMETVRRFLRNSFGEQAEKQGNDILMRLFDYRKSHGNEVWQRQIRQSCREMAMNMEAEVRLQLIAFLCEIAKADGNIHDNEVVALKSVASYLSLSEDIVNRMLSLGGTSLDDAYAVLGISKDATDDDVRKAYRRMAIEHHPDKVAALGDDIKAAATKKFQEINNAKERIFAARGMK